MGGEHVGGEAAEDHEPEPEDRVFDLEPDAAAPTNGYFKISGHLCADIRLQQHFMNTMLPLDYEIPIDIFLPLLEKFAAIEREKEQAALAASGDEAVADDDEFALALTRCRPGLYEIARDHTEVTAGPSMHSDTVSKLRECALVQVLEVQALRDEDRVRGRFEPQPDRGDGSSVGGWISLMKPSNSQVWAEYVEQQEDKENGEESGEEEEEKVDMALHHWKKRNTISAAVWEELQTKFMLEMPESLIEDSLFDVAVEYVSEPWKIDDLSRKLVSLEYRRGQVPSQQASGEAESEAGYVASSELCEALVQVGVPMLEIMNLCKLHKDHDALIHHSAFVLRLRERHGVRLPYSSVPLLHDQPKLKSKERLKYETVVSDNKRKTELIGELETKLKATKKELKELKKKVDHQFFNELFSMVNNKKKTNEEIEKGFQDMEAEDEGLGAAEDGQHDREEAEREVEAETRRAATTRKSISEMKENEFADPGMMIVDGSFMGKIITSSDDAEPDADGQRRGLALNIMIPIDGQLPIPLARANLQALAQSAMKFRQVYRHKGAAGTRMKKVWEEIDARLEKLYPNAGTWSIANGMGGKQQEAEFWNSEGFGGAAPDTFPSTTNGVNGHHSLEEQEEFWKSEYEIVKQQLAQKEKALARVEEDLKSARAINVSSFRPTPSNAPPAATKALAPTYAAAPTPRLVAALSPAAREAPQSQAPSQPLFLSSASASVSISRSTSPSAPKPPISLTSSFSAGALGSSQRSASLSRNATATASAAASQAVTPRTAAAAPPVASPPDRYTFPSAPKTPLLSSSFSTGALGSSQRSASLSRNATATASAAASQAVTPMTAAAPRAASPSVRYPNIGGFMDDLGALREIARENPKLKSDGDNPWFPQGGTAATADIVSQWKGVKVADGRVVELQIEVTSLPAMVSKLAALTVLDVTQSSSLRVLPDTIGDLPKLATIKLGGCRSLASLPDSVARLSSLTRLYLWHCKSLEALPPVMPKSLKTLSLKGCTGIRTLPPRLAECTALEAIDLNSCSGLSVLPAFLGDLPVLASARGNLDVRNAECGKDSSVVERLVARSCRVTAQNPAGVSRSTFPVSSMTAPKILQRRD